MSITRRVLRAQAHEHRVITNTTVKDRLRREKKVTRGMFNMRAAFRGLMHAFGHATRDAPRLDRYHQGIAARMSVSS